MTEKNNAEAMINAQATGTQAPAEEGSRERSAKLARLAISALEDKKGEDVRVVDIGDVSVLADYFIIATGRNRTQVQAMADEVEQRLGRAGAVPRQIEGYQAANWVLLDFGDVIIHIFDAQNRLFYDLERIWKDGRQIEPDTLYKEMF